MLEPRPAPVLAPRRAPMLEVTRLMKRFGGVTATNGCTLSVASGTITALIGPNGSGKTTLFHQISGLIRPDGGEITLEGRRIDGRPPHAISRAGIARTFQITRVFPSLTLLANLLVAAHDHPNRGGLKVPFDETAARRRAHDLLEFVGLHHLRDEPAGVLSYGQRKLLEFARAHINEPRLVLLDEPFAGVNPVLEARMVEHIKTMRDRGVTFFVIDHEMKIIMSLCHPIIVLDHGDVIAQGTAAEIQSNPAVIEAYFGS
ncbi:MAG TPA: ABC transporter ATP-binding protein [Chloroflexota bacterium]|nr:ABC transporter ATP-binding protein [Chloroflexota bacterium]